ncbi:Asp23/Gls24 family envelope stress response protein [Pseudothermotoga sp.]|uniref:Asp23/Gls24 family envelope stress response protein n=1 Tax=Pseudothermotoga sp. TaxID=2033661 RepID=UPI0031F6EC2D
MEKGFGTIDISDNAIREIAFRSACSVLDLTDERKQKKLRKSIDVDRTPEDSIIVSMKVTAPFGRPFIEIARKLMEQVKLDIERMTDQQVIAVNVVIDDVEESGISREGEEETKE